MGKSDAPLGSRGQIRGEIGGATTGLDGYPVYDHMKFTSTVVNGFDDGAHFVTHGPVG
jgi:hypothetical protein